ncbi:MAG: tetratricopeptide repeat protein [Terriglobales bacterium]
MTPYRKLRGAVCLYCLALIVLVVTAASPAVAAKKKRSPAKATLNIRASHLGNDPLTRSGFEHFYNMEYDKATRNFEAVLAEHPDDPFAVNHLLTAVLFKELYRIGALDSEIYANDNFMTARQLAVDPQVRARIRELTERSLALSEARLKQNPDDVDALYARGVTRATRSTAMGLLDKSWFAALRSALGARRDHERVLELDPTYTDAKMVVGIHNYVLGSLSWAVKAAAAVVGISGNKQKGIQYLFEAAQGSGEASVDAKIALSLFLRREQRYAEAIQLVGGLVQDYPRNFLVALEYANLQNAAGHGPEAIAAYRKLLAAGRRGLYTEPRLEQAAYMLGEALRGQNDFTGAAAAFESVNDFSNVEPELTERADLAAGQMYDVLEKRELAVKKYQQVIAANDRSWRAALARKYMKRPYRGPERKS